MRVFTIQGATHKGKEIRVTKYVKTSAGVEIAITHNVPTVTGKQLQWLQTVSSNGGFSKICKIMTRVDPFGSGSPGLHKFSLPSVPGTCKADDLLPFYWTVDDLKTVGAGFSDGPQVPAPASGRTWTKFITTLAEVTQKNVHHLVAIAWGYDRLADGTVKVAVIRTPSTVEMKEYGKVMKKMYPGYRYM